uniref:Calmodulin n=1 Tax=Syphacia muris TaxID=451379 RepID=A0A0N5AHR7_9BILA
LIHHQFESTNSTLNLFTEYRKAFLFFDENHDGQITLKELESAMKRCGQHPSKIELKRILNEADKDSNGVITYDEFIALMKNSEKRAKFTKEQVREQFKFFDKDKDGFIEKSEMLQIVRELSLDNMFPEKVIEDMFLEADVDGDGKISFEGYRLFVT